MTGTTDRIEGQTTLFGDPDAPPARSPGEQPGDGDGASAAPCEPPFDPSHWVMAGWRDARGAPPVTWQQLNAVLNITHGPCARCGTPHHRYGDGGQPHCPACRSEPRPRQ